MKELQLDITRKLFCIDSSGVLYYTKNQARYLKYHPDPVC